MMRLLFGPDDWLGQYPHLCMMVVGAAILINGALTDV
jgi:hypothetical protein